MHPIFSRLCSFPLLAAILMTGLTAAQADDAPLPPDAAKRGFDVLIHKPMTTVALKTADLDTLWTVWEPEPRALAEKASPEERRRLTFERYGFIPRNFDSSGLPLGYTEDGKGNLVSNCLSCHGGKIEGKPMPGAGNAFQDLAAIDEDTQLLRAVAAGKDLEETRKNLHSPFVLNHARGGTNAFTFSVALGTMRDTEMKFIFPPRKLATQPVNHDEDAPPWWTYKKKSRIYWTAFAHPSTRTLMQFVTTPNNSAEEIKALEPDFELIKAYINSLEPPKFPWPIDRAKAEEGRKAFEESCARCHGTYGPESKYPNKVVPLSEVKTDPVRLTAIPPDWAEYYNKSWLTNYGQYPFDPEPKGYLAPPLDGIWASAPYFHNGSVPTLYGVIHPSERPNNWTRSESEYDQKRVGLKAEAHDKVPEGLSNRARRAYYESSTQGHGNGGHLFAEEELSDEEKDQVLEYLKTL